ncbi:hypothetical protein RQP46_008917 [Phenoliferia psychrophenolica]
MGRARLLHSHKSRSSVDDDSESVGDRPALSDDIHHFKDKPMEHSRRDELRMGVHDLRADLKEQRRTSKGKGKGRQQPDLDPAVVLSLARSPSLARTATSSGGSGTEDDDDLEHQHDDDDDDVQGVLAHPVGLSSDSYFSTHSSPAAGRSSSTDDLPSMTSTPPSTPPIPRGRAPVVNAPDLRLINSRAAPVSPESPARLASTGSFSPPHSSAALLPLSLSPSKSLLHPPPSESASSDQLHHGRHGSPMRRANTTGSPLVSSSSRQSSPSPRIGGVLPIRTQSYSQPQQRSFSQSSEPAGDDDVDASIAAQAEVIRKERLEKRLEKEKEQAETARTGGVASGPQTSLRRRSTRAGSGSEVGGAGVLVGNLIGQDHANYVLMYNMLTGIRIGVSRCQAKLKRPLTDADYTARHKFSFDIVGNELTPSTKYDFKFKDYAPWVFRELREYFYLDPGDYLVSLTAKYILSELGSPGKSGSFFYFSRDYRFIIKTIRHAEHKFLRSILKEYYEYVKSNPHTLLSRFYGLHRVKLPHGKKIHFVIMNNLFPPHRDIHESYDLKGSAIGRITPEDKWRANPNAILKDLNWVERNRQLALGPEKKALFEEQLRRDTELMQKLGIMDYSLLTGIHNTTRGNTDNLRDGMLTVFQPEGVKIRKRQPTQVKRDADASALRQAIQRSDPKALDDVNKLPDADTSERQRFLFYQDEGGIRATGDDNEDLGVIYYLGIIDILTPYSTLKKIEHFFKGMQHDKHMISAVPPKEYGDRFLAFIRSVIRGNDTSQRPRMYEGVPGGKGKGPETEKAKVE